MSVCEARKKPEGKKKKPEEGFVVRNCSICLGPMRKKDNLRALKCGHVFHADCIESWLKKSNECPICRMNVND